MRLQLYCNCIRRKARCPWRVASVGSLRSLTFLWSLSVKAQPFGWCNTTIQGIGRGCHLFGASESLAWAEHPGAIAQGVDKNYVIIVTGKCTGRVRHITVWFTVMSMRLKFGTGRNRQGVHRPSVSGVKPKTGEVLGVAGAAIAMAGAAALYISPNTWMNALVIRGTVAECCGERRT